MMLHLRGPSGVGIPIPGSNKVELGLNPDSTLGGIVDDSVAQELTPTMLVADAWAVSKKRTSQSSIIAKLNSM